MGESETQIKQKINKAAEKKRWRIQEYNKLFGVNKELI